MRIIDRMAMRCSPSTSEVKELVESEMSEHLPARSDRARDICTFVVASLVLFEVRSRLV